MPAGGVVEVHKSARGYRQVWLVDTPALCNELRAEGLGDMAAAVHSIAAGHAASRSPRAAVNLWPVHSGDRFDAALSRATGQSRRRRAAT